MSSSATVRVEKATSDLLIGPDWTMNIDICDSINSDHWQAKDVVKVVKKRLQNKNPKVQFLALTLLETMMKNCGDYVHFQVVDRNILEEMVKIVRKKTDMPVRDKILVLLDSWQEAFGGPGGKYPQYYWAYADLKRSGVEFPERSVDASLMFTPVTHPTPVPRHPQAGYGMPSNSSIRLDEAMASEMGNLSLSDLDSFRSVMELLSDMLQAVNPNDHEAVKDEVITDLINQCRSNQKRLMQLVISTGDEELLGQGLALNDNLQILLAKHDAIASGSPLPIEASASGSPLPIEASESIPRPNTPIASTPVVNNRYEAEEEEEDDDFAQLARRNSKFKPVTSQDDQEALPNQSNMGIATTANSATEASSSIPSNALALPDPPTPVRTATKEQDMIDLLSITLSTNASPPHTPLTPPSASYQNGSPAPVSPNGQPYPYNSQPYSVNQGYIPYNSYVAPWAQHALPQSPPPPQPQPQMPQYSSSYPPPPWAANQNPFPSTTYQFPASHANTAAAYTPMYNSRPLQQYNSFGSRVNSVPASTGETQVNANLRQAGPATAPKTGPATAPKPFIPSNRLFEDLIDLRNADGSLKMSSTSPSLSGTSGQSMIGGRK